MTFGKNIQNTLEQSLHDSVFVWVCFLINFSSFKPHTKNNANFENYASHCLSTRRRSVNKTKF